MKAFTNLEQSKKLAKILPLESADMYYSKYDTIHAETLYSPCDIQYFNIHEHTPCWSLASLINVLPADWWGYNEHYFLEISKMGDASKSNKVCYYRFRKEIDGANYDRIPHISYSAENLIDACVNMIITLHEHKLI